MILLSSVVLWFLQGYGIADGALRAVEDNNTSLLATIGSAIAFLFAPLGFGSWKPAVAVFTGLIAKENVVGTFGVLYQFGGLLTGEVAFGTGTVAALLCLAALSPDRWSGKRAASVTGWAAGRRPPGPSDGPA